MCKTVLGVDEDIFLEHFFDTRHHKAKPGQALAKFTAVAEFVAGKHKQDIIDLLKTDKAKQAAMVMRKIHLAREPDCYRLLAEMCEDLVWGMTEEEVEERPYKFVLEAYFYVKRDLVPKNDPHWELLPLIQYDKEKKEYTSKIEL